MAERKWLENADFVARSRELDTKKVTGSLAPVTTPPTEVLDRLKTYGLTWEALPNYAKQALIWDTGYVIGNVNKVDKWLKVYVKIQSITMANIAFTSIDFNFGATQSTRSCPSPLGSYSRQQMANFEETNPVVHCAIEDTMDKIEYSNSSIFSQDTLGSTDIPEPRVYMHKDHIGIGPCIHMLPRGWKETPWNTCQDPTKGSSMIIPCTIYGKIETGSKYRPKPSDTMNKWLEDLSPLKSTVAPASTYTPTSTSPSNGAQTSKEVESSSSGTGVGIGIGVGAALLVCIIAFFIFRRRRNNANNGKSGFTSTDYIATPEGPISTNDLTSGFEALNEIDSCRLDEKDLVLTKKLGAGAFADVWLGSFRGEPVAIKKLHNNRVTSSQIVSFVDEIKLMSTFSSPYIVNMIGAAWTRATDICCVMELMEGGDLKDFLDQTTPATFPWNDKIKHIYSIVSGLTYLHSMNIMHRDIKSRNILLDAKKGTKLTDFGISKEDMAATMTLGVGTFRWMAPEVVQDQEYTVAADIYSFGCVLSEFDTHHIPYEDLKNPATGQPISDSAIMVKVTTGTLKPSFTNNCPPWIQQLAMQCLNFNPDMRPTAAQIGYTIQSKLRELSANPTN